VPHRPRPPAVRYMMMIMKEAEKEADSVREENFDF
jgi:hypothetical protein